MDNIVDLDKDGQWHGRPVVAADFGSGEDAPTLVTNLFLGPLTHVTVEPAATALAHVLAEAGCSLHRDSVDMRLIDAVQSYGIRGKIIHSEAEAGGPGTIAEVHAVAQKP
jgi:hypothetical protein